jgi:hypothetical protein
MVVTDAVASGKKRSLSAFALLWAKIFRHTLFQQKQVVKVNFYRSKYLPSPQTVPI